MANFMFWCTGQILRLGVSVRMFLERLIFESVGEVKLRVSLIWLDLSSELEF